MRPLIPALFLFVLSALMPTSPAGSYAGTWTGSSAEGGIKIALSQAAEKGPWKAEVSFSYGDNEIKCKTVSIKVDDGKLDLVYDFEIASIRAQSTVSGEIKGQEISGKFHTLGADGADVDQGTFKVSLTK
ncbi:MAG TPA: hypothetical protein VNW97_20500 [Candidatus Saccharimonadales bacterium]|jgi:hypothetical protein|nr:hypothetical protein [Candidatus Saccharimonadales bacterium]